MQKDLYPSFSTTKIGGSVFLKKRVQHPSNSSGVEVQESESVSISVAMGILKMDGLLAGDLVPPTRLGREEGLKAGDMARWPLTILYLMGMEVEM
ncbi:hypothetical protein AVEN_138377-1 [Araneus ventricosus]|uniref:Uncharacterized protein n=1 Tax=Araneus ventricosus TaxID=182803 RepID=A0A4Y2VVT5_ARAVE|nr:hypothetical protein AVEN_138377-1 [Araneus ventricosus]